MIYQPREDTYLIEKEVKKYTKNKSVLDLGSGSGILSKAAIEGKAKSILAADINKSAVIELKKQGFNAIHSDLFSDIKNKYDLIIFNPPYLPENKKESKSSQISTTGGRKGDEIILRFLKQAKSHLNKKGIILTLISSLTPQQRIDKLLTKLKFIKQIISSQSFFFETLEVWEIKN